MLRYYVIKITKLLVLRIWDHTLMLSTVLGAVCKEMKIVSSTRRKIKMCSSQWDQILDIRLSPKIQMSLYV